MSLACRTDAAPESWKAADTCDPGSASLPEYRVSALACPASALGLEDGHQNAVTPEGKKVLSGNGTVHLAELIGLQ